MNTRSLFAGLATVALLASPAIASAATTAKVPAAKTAAMTANTQCKGLHGKALADCKAKVRVAARTAVKSTAKAAPKSR
ncbi:hypothetical protein ACFO0A_01855 [Novosphingobium tardum]|uniref:Phosphate starvation-inducible protein PsiF n=1 Tax=Novosphingobium tardum TaxID=1538021 RepID=A0ABV8RLI0_9SPHN